MSTTVCAWVIVSFHNCHFHATRLEYLRVCQTGTRAEHYTHNSRCLLPLVSPLVRAPAAWKCRNGRLTEEKPFHLVTTAVYTACSYRNTIKMILLPSHITCCAGFCINVLKALPNGFNICFNILSILLNGNVESVCHPPSTLLKRVERMLNRC